MLFTLSFSFRSFDAEESARRSAAVSAFFRSVSISWPGVLPLLLQAARAIRNPSVSNSLIFHFPDPSLAGQPVFFPGFEMRNYGINTLN
jgi:hypothetical protein